MTTEEISIEETNILRAKVGLPPIPVADEKPREYKKDLSLEETNKLRISLGLNPIEVKSEDIEQDHFRAFQEGKEKQRKDEELIHRLHIAKDKKERKRKIADNNHLYNDDEVTTDSWLDSLTIKKPKSIERIIKANNVDTNEISGQIAHSSRDLQDLKDDEILTLNDNHILDETDQLSNERLKGQTKIKKDLEEKNKVRDIKGGRYYSATNEEDEEEFVKLNGSEIKFNEKVEVTQNKGKNRAEFDLFDEFGEPPKVRKPTKMKRIKKKENKSRVKDDTITIQTVELEPFLNEEEDIEDKLSLQRKLKQQSRKFLKPEDIAKEIRQFERIQQEELVEKLTSNDGGMLFDQMDDFLTSLTAEAASPREVIEKEVTSPTKLAKPEADIGNLRNNSVPDAKEIQISSSATIKKTDVGSGLGSTLRYLRENNLIKETSETVKQRSKVLSQAEELKQRMKRQEESVRKELQSDSKYQSLSGVEKENYFRSKLDDYLQAHRSTTDFFEKYQPNVQLTYRDRKGNALSTKDAFKQLSSEYHGTSKAHNKKDRQNSKKKS
ncbi:66 kDa U4/U6.U5 small nuclear ribonucleoprotein component [[Candida] jaroonii]|uniref:66 kDa U4/U6.U5 small nuclear ribonucleoprotein component n=1 Tax=[Candida] jaroonii TaxID=467808 RepID=A0ACA9YBP6_9ASCO|nr:66 kDa U4/U6.U5 small nuclear ribonucleoprotein component [[Candida] jaroonii]